MAKRDFSLGQGLGNFNPTNLANGVNNQRWGKVIYVSPQMIMPNPKNKYEVVDIEDLADNISMYGLLQPLIVKGPFPDNKYMLLGGERRWTAVGKVIETNPEAAKKLEKIPIVVYGPADMDEVDEEIIIRETNRLARDMSKYQMQDIWELNDLYKQKKERGEEVPPNIVKHIAEKMGVGVRQVQKIISIDEHLIPDIKEEMEESGLTINQASKIAHLSKEKQEEVHDLIKEQGSISMEEIKKIEAGEPSGYIDLPEIEEEPEREEEKTMDEEDSVIVESDSTEHFYETARQVERENKEKNFIDKMLNWMRDMNKKESIESYQRDAIKRIRELADSILEP